VSDAQNALNWNREILEYERRMSVLWSTWKIFVWTRNNWLKEENEFFYVAFNMFTNFKGFSW